MRVSKNSTGFAAEGPCYNPYLSGNGLFVSYQCFGAVNMLDPSISSNRGNFFRQIFIRSLWDDSYFAVASHTNSNPLQAGDGDCSQSSMSWDGKIIAFDSKASDLIANWNGSLPINGNHNIFVLDLNTREMTLASVSTEGGSADGDCVAPSLSGDGSLVVFSSNAGNLVENSFVSSGEDYRIYLRDLSPGGKTQLISLDNNGAILPGSSFNPFISLSGNAVAWSGNGAQNFTRYSVEIYVRDLENQVTSIASRSFKDVAKGYPSPSGPLDYSIGSYLPILNANATIVGFESNALDLVNLSSIYTEIPSSVFVSLAV